MTWIEHILGVLMLVSCGGIVLGVLVLLALIGGATLDDTYRMQ